MEYKALFERRLMQVLANLGISDYELTTLCDWLKQHGGGFLPDGGTNAFVEAAITTL